MTIGWLSLFILGLAEMADGAPQRPAPTATATPRPREWKVTFENRSRQDVKHIYVSGLGWDNFDRGDVLGSDVLGAGRSVAVNLPEELLVGHERLRCRLPVRLVMQDDSLFLRDLNACTTARWIVTDEEIRLVAR